MVHLQEKMNEMRYSTERYGTVFPNLNTHTCHVTQIFVLKGPNKKCEPEKLAKFQRLNMKLLEFVNTD